jgi:hypothetical protein
MGHIQKDVSRRPNPTIQKNAAGKTPAALQLLNSLVQALRAPFAKPLKSA